MLKGTRRQIVKGGALAAMGLALDPLEVLAQSKSGLVRYNVASPQGQAMLAIYKTAVASMKAKGEGDPLGWLFQWYTHAVRSDRTKAGEIARIYPQGGANATLAQQTWFTCQAHSGQREDFFLPWHRMYVNTFEAIIRKVSGNNSFTLPYWDYTDPNQQVLPAAFRTPANGTNALYTVSRWAQINAGGKVTGPPQSNPLTLNCMRSPTYSASGGDAGFCANTDQNPHGALHVDVGNGQGMASVPWAANDPIFYLHHCQIDRIWASWNKAGGKNPTDSAFLNATFTFAAPGGGGVTYKVSDVLAGPATPYDTLIPRPAGSPPFPSGQPFRALFAFAPSQNESESPPVTLTSGEKTTVALVGHNAGGVSALAGANSKLLGASLAKVESGGPVSLLLQGLSAKARVDGSYAVYVHGTDPNVDPNGPAYVGHVHFFGLGEAHQHGAGPVTAETEKSVSFYLRPETQDYLKKADLDAPHVSLVPQGTIDPSSAPTIRVVKLVG